MDGKHERTVTVDGQRLYELMKRPRAGEHRLRLELRAGRGRLRVHVRLRPARPRSCARAGAHDQQYVIGAATAKKDVLLAHPMLQYLAQGACMAIEDAVCLANRVESGARRLRRGVRGLSGRALSAHRPRADHGARLWRVLSRQRRRARAAQHDAVGAHAGAVVRGDGMALRRGQRPDRIRPGVRDVRRPTVAAGSSAARPAGPSPHEHAATTAMPGAGRGERRGAGPGDRGECFREGRGARRCLPPAEVAALGLGAEQMLDLHRRRRGHDDAERGHRGVPQRQPARSRRRTAGTRAPIAPITASILARTIRAAATGAVATSSGASSPEIASQARPPASCPAAITSTGTSTTSGAVAFALAAPEQDGGRQQIEDLHQRSATPARGRAAAAAIPSAAARGRGSPDGSRSTPDCRRVAGSATPPAASAHSPKLRREQQRSSRRAAARLTPSTAASAARSPNAARAGQ